MRSPSLKNNLRLCLPFALLLSGCASLTPEQCKTADWQQIGFTDGTRGERGDRIDEHAKACAEVGIRPDLNAYLRGRYQGLNSYCQAENGFNLGLRGMGNNAGDCPENLKPGFLEQYEHGYQIHAIEAALANLNRRLDDNRHHFRSSEGRIEEIRAELDRKDLPVERRTALLAEYERLVERKDMLLRELRPLQREIEVLRVQLGYKLSEYGR